MRCSKCGVDNRETARFCDGCGSPLEPQCGSCGALNRAGAKFCDGCGASLSVAALTAPATNANLVRFSTDIAPQDRIDGERKTVTALFADIKGSMELMEDLDPEEARAIVDPALKLMIEAVRHYGGYVVQSTGDGIFALFGAPRAHEDHPQRALYAALRLQEEMRRYSAQLRQAGNLPVEARVGVNTGDVVVRSIATGENHPEYTPIGHSISLAARMQALAPTGSIAVTDGARKLCEGFFTFRTLGPTRVKGVSEPVEVFEVAGLGPLRTRLQVAARRGLTKFVGREREMEALKHALEQAKTGHGQIVAAIAEPGVGKSRLFYEFKATSQSGCMVLEAYSVSHGKASAYLPVLELLSSYFEIGRDDDDRKRRERILGKVLGLDRNLEDALPYLYSLYGIADAGDSLAQMDPQIRRRRTLEAIKRILLRESLNLPLMVIFEDLHWIDSETQALLNLLVDTIANARILLLVNYRPEYRHEWSSRTHFTQLRVDPLGKVDAEEMLSALLGDHKDLLPLKRLVIERTEGTPFFMEEMVQALFEEEVLRRNGTVKLAGPMSTVKVPATVQAVLASRVDRMPAVEKELLQTLAVMGREFSLTLVRRVWQNPHPRITAFAEQEPGAAPLALSRQSPSPHLSRNPSAALTAGSAGHGQTEAGEEQPELEQMLARLQLGEFIYEQPAVSDLEYSFKHALTLEVVYNSVLIERRRQLHQLVAAAIEFVLSDTINDHLDELARHYSRAGRPDKAIEYFRRAGEQALHRCAYGEAQSNLTAALALLDGLPDDAQRAATELQMQLALGIVLTVTQSFDSPERKRVYERARELCQRNADTDELVPVLWHLCQSSIQTPDGLAEGFELAERALRLAERSNRPGQLVAAHYNMGESLIRLGRAVDAATHLNRALTLYDARQHRPLASVYGIDLWIVSSWLLSWVELVLGKLDRAAARAQATVAQGREIGHPYGLGFALFGAAWVEWCRGNLHQQRQLAQSAGKLAAENGFAEIGCWAGMLEGHALFAQGQPDAGIALMAEATRQYRLVGGLSNLSFLSDVLIDAYNKAGQVDDARELLTAAFSDAQPWNEAQLLRLKGNLYIAQAAPDLHQAEICFRRSIELSRCHQTKFLELRATTSLARLLRDTNRRDEACRMLAEIYNWFTEGFDTIDLKDARALLEQLNG